MEVSLVSPPGRSPSLMVEMLLFCRKGERVKYLGILFILIFIIVVCIKSFCKWSCYL